MSSEILIFTSEETQRKLLCNWVRNWLEKRKLRDSKSITNTWTKDLTSVVLLYSVINEYFDPQLYNKERQKITNTNIVEHTHPDMSAYFAAAYLNTVFSSGIHHWKLRLLYLNEGTNDDGGWIIDAGIGLEEYTLKRLSGETKGYGIAMRTKSYGIRPMDPKAPGCSISEQLGPSFSSGDIIDLYLNISEITFFIAVNGQLKSQNLIVKGYFDPKHFNGKTKFRFSVVTRFVGTKIELITYDNSPVPKM